MKVPISQALAELDSLPHRPYVAFVDGWWRVLWGHPTALEHVFGGRTFAVCALTPIAGPDMRVLVERHGWIAVTPTYELYNLCCAVALWRHANPDAMPSC